MHESAPPTACAAGLLVSRKLQLLYSDPVRPPLSGFIPQPRFDAALAAGGVVCIPMVIRMVAACLVNESCKLGNASGCGKADSRNDQVAGMVA
jgi:hypothetical protein